MVDSYEDVIKTREEFVAWASGLEKVVPREYNPNLHYVSKYLVCKYDGCGRAGKTPRHMQEHANSHEGWYEPGRRGKKTGGSGESRWYRKDVFAQRLFRSGLFSHYWVIDEPPRDGIAQEDDVCEAVRNLFDEGGLAMQNFEEEFVKAAPEKREPNPLLKKLGYPKLLSGFRWMDLVALGAPVDRDEDGLRRVDDSIGKVLNKAKLCCQRNLSESVSLFEIQRTRCNESAARPLLLEMEDRSWEAYTRLYRKVLRIIMRANEDENGSRGNWLRLPYVLSELQSDLLAKLAELGRTEAAASDTGTVQAKGRCSPEMESTILQLIEALLDHESGDYAQGQAMVVALAVTAMKGERRWQESSSIAEGFSAFLKISRIIVLYNTYRERQVELEDMTNDGTIGPVEAMALGTLLLHRVRTKVEQFMIQTGGVAKSGPMEWVLRHQAYLVKAAKETVLAGKLELLGGERIKYDGIDIDLGLVRTMFKAAELELYQALARLLLLTEKEILLGTENGTLVSGRLFESGHVRLPESLSTISDTHTDSTLGHSWLKEASNEAWVRQGDGFLMQKMMGGGNRGRWLRYQGVEGKRLLPVHGSDHVFSPREVGQYGNQVASFLGKLLFAIHVTGGQPARGTELLTLRLWNTNLGGTRNVVLWRGMVAFVTLYWKRSWANDNNIVWRFLPDTIGRALLWYQWLVLPFWTNICSQIKSSAQASPFLWDEAILFREEYASREKLRRYRGRQDDMGQDDMGQDDFAADTEEADREEAVSVRKKQDNIRCLLGERPWTAARFSDLIRSAFAKHVEAVGVGLRAWRQVAVHITRIYLDERFVGDADDGGGDADDDDDFSSSVWDLTAAHSSQVAKTRYANPRDQMPFSGSSLHMVQCMRVAKKWHIWIGMATPAEVAGMPEAIVVAPDDSRILARQARAFALINAPMEDVLATFLGSGATFRGKQLSVIRQLARQASLVWIAPTGQGKSMAFMLPAYVCPAGITIVVVPLNQLKSNLEKRARKFGITVEVWTVEHLPSGVPSILFITPEAAVKPAFQTWYMLYRSLCLVDRVVFDECHCILEAELRGFRRAYLAMTSFIMNSGVSVLFQTATLAPYEEKDLMRAIRAPPGSVAIIRERTTRINLVYRVTLFDKEPEGRQLLQNTIDEVDGRFRGLVFCPTKALVEEIGALLRLPWVHADLPTDDKNQTIRKWFKEGGVIVATDVLGMGIDIGDVRFVIHFMAPGDMSTYVQQSGRAGRDGRGALAMLITRRTRYAHDPTISRGVDYMRKYAASAVCRRIVLDEAMDGAVGRRGCLEGERTCDVCRHGDDGGNNKGPVTARQPLDRQMEVRTTQMVARTTQMVARSVDPAMARDALANINKADSLFQRERLRAVRNTWTPNDLNSALGFWSTIQCEYCQVREGIVYHAAANCQVAEFGNVFDVQVPRRSTYCGKTRYRFQGCFGQSFRCLLPQFACPSWKPAVHDRPDKRAFVKAAQGYDCRYAGVMDVVVASGLSAEFAARNDLGLEEKIKEMGYEGGLGLDNPDLWKWLVLPRVVTPDKLQGSNLVEVFMYIHRLRGHNV